MCALDRMRKEVFMLDVLIVLVVLAFFALCIGFTSACERL